MPRRIIEISLIVPLVLPILLLGLTMTTPLPAQVAETCDNGIDDDGDGLVDCEDDDCAFPQFFSYALLNSPSRGVALGDLDGDGDLDTWVANHGANRVWINQGGDQGGVAGNFAYNGQALGNSYSSDVSLGDLDGDGDLDAWVTNDFTQPNRVWINDGLGNFTDSGQALGNSASRNVTLGDLDGDSDLDAWVANWGGSGNQANRVWINQGGIQGGGAGNFADSGLALGNSYSLDVSLGDLDGDGDLDAWVANSGPNRVWINDGLGNFTDSGQALGNSTSYGFAHGDLDGDGDLDAWVANTGPNRVWINDGLGNFTDSGQELGDSASHNVALGDLDGDGDLDAWVANFGDDGNQANRVWINQAGVQGGEAGNFAESGQALGNSWSLDVSLGDLDGDGDLDAWVANWDSPNRVFMNLSQCENFFRRGDGNGDGAMNLTDAVHSLGYLYGTTVIDCFDANDTNDDGSFNISDPIYLLGYLFNAGPDPLAPFPSCDLDPTDDFLGCGSYDGC